MLIGITGNTFGQKSDVVDYLLNYCDESELLAIAFEQPDCLSNNDEEEEENNG